jgi:endonuclease G
MIFRCIIKGLVVILLLAAYRLPVVLAQTQVLPEESCRKHQAIAQVDVSAKEGLFLLCRNSYLSVYDTSAKVPFYTSYFSSSKTAAGCAVRSNKFEADLALPKNLRVHPKDYTGSGFDRGHVVPDGDMSYNIDAELDSFLVTNVVVQHPNFNRGVWKSLEIAVRNWAVSGRDLQVISGPVYSASSKRIRSGIVIPDAFYKIVVDLSSREYLAFYFKHTSNTTDSFAEHQVSLSELQSLANLKLTTSLDISKKYPLWEARVNATDVKRIRCN